MRSRNMYQVKVLYMMPVGIPRARSLLGLVALAVEAGRGKVGAVAEEAVLLLLRGHLVRVRVRVRVRVGLG